MATSSKYKIFIFTAEDNLNESVQQQARFLATIASQSLISITQLLSSTMQSFFADWDIRFIC